MLLDMGKETIRREPERRPQLHPGPGVPWPSPKTLCVGQAGVEPEKHFLWIHSMMGIKEAPSSWNMGKDSHV